GQATPSINASSKKPLESSFGRRLYVARYVSQGIRRHKRRSLSLLIGIMIGVALVSSVFVWTETGARVAIDDYFASASFHYYGVQNPNPPNDNPQAIFPVKQFVDMQITTQASYIVYSSIALLESTNLDPSDIYLPYAYSRGIKDCQVFFVDNDFLERAERSFRIIAGEFQVSPGTVLLSQHVVEDLDRVMGVQVSIGSVIDVSVARDYNSVYNFASINPTDINGLRITGIYEVISGLEPLLEAFPSQSRYNWGPIRAAETVFGWFDSIILANTVLSSETYDEITQQVMFPRLLVELAPVTLYFMEIEQIIATLDRLFTNLQLSYDITVGGRDQLLFFQDFIEIYHERQTMVILVLPMVILSVLLTIFTSSLFLSKRRAELAILRSRGASYQQLYSILMFEFLILSVIGVISGGFLGILLGCMIPSASSFLIFSLTIFLRYLSLTSVNVVAWIVAGLLCIVPAAIYIFMNTRSFLKSELYSELRENSSIWKQNPRLQLGYAVIVMILTLPLGYGVLSVPLSVELALVVFIFIVSFWVLLADALARLIRPGIAWFSRLLAPAIGQKNHLFVKGMRVQRTRVVPLLMILLLTFSITIFSAIEAQTYQYQLDQQISYYVGADVRVYSERVLASRINEILFLPHINIATAFIEVPAEIGESNFQLIGCDPAAYAQIGNWDKSSMVGEDYRVVLDRLATNHNGIILPAHIASLYGSRVGEPISVLVRDQRTFIIEVKEFDVVGIMNTAPGLGYTNPSDPGASIAPNPGFGFQKSDPFALCHQQYFLVQVPLHDPYSVADSTNFFLAGLNPSASVQEAQDGIESLDFVHRTWSPHTFDLKEAYHDGYLFSQGIISLLSVGFLASLSISVVALTVFVSTIVSERKTEYAILRALGGSRRDITSMVLVEFVSLILLAFTFSLIIGIAFSWLLMFVIIKLFPQPFIIPFSIIYPLSLLITVLGLVILGLFTGAYLPARRAGQVPVNTLLRNL
ncbi:MAG: FtsX-like permease family protein, partial [Candidatus Thorarchaeota archaeon]